MQHRLDGRLLQLPVGSLHAIGSKLCRVDETKGWWDQGTRLARGVLEQTRARVVEDALAALVRVDGSGQPTERGSAIAPSGTEAQLRYAQTLRHVLDSHAEIDLTEDAVLDLHTRLLAAVREGNPDCGRYRTAADQVVSGRRTRLESVALMPTAPHLVAAEMKRLVEWTAERLASSEFHPILVIGSFLLELMAIRPFTDGNGRVGRLLTHLLLLRCGYSQVAHASLDMVIANRWTECLLALRRSQASRNLARPDISVWLEAFVALLVEQGAALRASLENHREDMILSPNQLGALELLEHGEEITNRLVCRRLGLPRDTAKQVLGRLVDLGLIERLGAGRSVRYRRVRSRLRQRGGMGRES